MDRAKDRNLTPCIVRLGDVVDNVNDFFDRNSSDAVRYVAGEHIDERDLRVRRFGMTSDDLVPPTFNRLFKAGDVLFHSRNIRKLCQPNFNGLTGEKLFVLRTKDADRLAQDFLPLVLRAPQFARYAEERWAGSTNKFLNKAPLMAYEFELPPLSEQLKAVELLHALLNARYALEGALAEADRARRAALLDTFRPDRGESDSFPDHWDIRIAGDVGDVQLGQQRHPKYERGSNIRPYLRVANVMDGWIDFSDINQMHFPEKDLHKFELLPGDILLNEGQSFDLVGRSAIYSGEFPGLCCQKTLIRFRCGSELLPGFAQAYFQHRLYTGQFAAMCVQTTSIAHLTAVRFSAMKMPVPPLGEQERIARTVTKLSEAATEIQHRLKAVHGLGAAVLGLE